jgi:Uri superfamily endonuclease
LIDPAVEIETIHFTEAEGRKECVFASVVADHGTTIKGFGCSDCKCKSHLYKVEDIGFIEKLGLKKRVKVSPQLP